MDFHPVTPALYASNMSTGKQTIEDIFDALPPELQKEVLAFATFLLERNSKKAKKPPLRSVSSFFGVWGSGDPRSADNDRIDQDLVDEYSNSHDTE
jgi:hypothetical protein